MFHGRKVTEEELRTLIERANESPKLVVLLDLVAAEFMVRRFDVFETNRSQAFADARHVVWWVMQKQWCPKFSAKALERTFGYDHSTVLSGVRRIEKEVEQGTLLGQTALRVASKQLLYRVEAERQPDPPPPRKLTPLPAPFFHTQLRVEG